MALSDAQYVAFLVKAGRRLNRVLNLTGTTNAIVVDTNTGEMTSPTDNPDLEDLLLLQAECLILQRNTNEAIEEGTTGVSVKDGEQSIDTTAGANLRGRYLDSGLNPCDEFYKAIKQYKLDNFGGRMVY